VETPKTVDLRFLWIGLKRSGGPEGSYHTQWARVLRQTLMHVLTRAKNQGELSSDANLDSMVDFFESTLAGIRMAAKAGKSRQALRNIAVFAARAYMAPDCRRAPK
jgi:hypothetical protein